MVDDWTKPYCTGKYHKREYNHVVKEPKIDQHRYSQVTEREVGKQVSKICFSLSCIVYIHFKVGRKTKFILIQFCFLSEFISNGRFHSKARFSLFFFFLQYFWQVAITLNLLVFTRNTLISRDTRSHSDLKHYKVLYFYCFIFYSRIYHSSREVTT